MVVQVSLVLLPAPSVVFAASADTQEQQINSQANEDSSLTTGAKDDVCTGIKLATGESSLDCENTTEVSSLVSTIISILSWLLGIVAVIMIIIGSFKYIASGGDSGKVASAKNTIVYALIGLVLATLSQLLVRFVLNSAT